MPSSPKHQSQSHIILTTMAHSHDIPKAPWSDTPSELLSSISDGLGLIDLLSFRAVCKDWHSASSTASASIESNPWFLLYGEGSNCVLYNHKDKKKYNINIPKLEGTTCLASDQGWLLLSRGNSIFFFCPFSGAKIDLPEFPHEDIKDHVAAFSRPPTSEDCIVSIINRCDAHKVELNVIHRGENVWTPYLYDRPQNTLDTVTCGTFCDGTFYFSDKKDVVLTFSPNDKKWEHYKIVKSCNPSIELHLPFLYSRRYFSYTNMKTLLDLGENVGVSTCGMMIQEDKHDFFIHNENIKASSGESESGNLKGIWIHPRFHKIPLNQGWSI